MDDEKKMTLGAEEEKQFHSRFPFSLSRLATSHFYLVLSPFFFFSADTRRPWSVLTIWHERGTRTRNASCPRSPRSRDDCNLHKLSFHFDDDIAETPAVKKRGVVNDRKDRILCASCFRSSWYSIKSFQSKRRSRSTLFISSSWLSSRYIKSQKKKERCNKIIHTSGTIKFM